ncbi:aldo-keto reductase family 1 member A1 [Parasteatoda tepidariorum]|uniref:aldo-keto reductase family 1 member A1 n=1 Tax=Parasteatoda tepidariorum TaxID=114398 RepID=UPI0039BC84BF
MDSTSEDNIVVLNNGQHMPIIGLGMFQTKDGDDIDSVISTAIDAGYRLIDTAFTYNNEHLLGQALQKLFKSGKIKREELFITSKLPPNGMQPDVVEQFFQVSLTDLQLDYIDLYLIHCPFASKRQEDDRDFFPVNDDGNYDADTAVDLTQTWKEMEKLVKKGLVKSIGLSNCNSQQIRRIYDSATIKPAVLQVECHAYLPQFELQDFCKILGIAFTAYAPLGSPYRAPGDEEVRLLDDPSLKPLCEKHGKTPAQVLLRYLIQRRIIVIPKSTNEKRLKENIDVFDFTLQEPDMDALKCIDRRRRYFSFARPTGIPDHPEYPFNIPY